MCVCRYIYNYVKMQLFPSATSCVCVVPAQELDDNLSGLTHEFEQATAAKLKCQQQAESTANTISLANRYIAHAVSKLKSSFPHPCST